jgi:hypothetical protein
MGHADPTTPQAPPTSRLLKFNFSDLMFDALASKQSAVH